MIIIVVGDSQSSGKSDGDATIAKFNFPSSVVLFNSSKFPQNRTLSTKVIYSKNSTNCIYSNFKNFTNCTLENLEDLALKEKEEKIDHKKIKLIRTDVNFTVNYYDSQYLFVADKNNHCIRKVDLLNAYVTTYAGQCGFEGFKDGPFKINRLSYPDNIGLDLDGNIFVYDSGNKYIRMIDSEGNTFFY